MGTQSNPAADAPVRPVIAQVAYLRAIAACEVVLGLEEADVGGGGVNGGGGGGGVNGSDGGGGSGGKGESASPDPEPDPRSPEKRSP